MRILMLNYEFPPIGGGGGLASLNVLRCYANKTDLFIDTVTSMPGEGLVVEPLSTNISVHKIGIKKPSLQFWRRSEVISWLWKADQYLDRLLATNSYDIAHAFFAFPTGYLCWRRDIPYIISLRGSDVPGHHSRLQLDYKILAPLMRSIWKRARLIVACSRGLRDRALRFLPSAGIEVVPNGVDLDRFHPAKTNYTDRPLRLLTVGRLSVTKRTDILVDTMHLLTSSGLDARLTIVGAGPMEAAIRVQISRKGLEDIVHLKGQVKPDQMPDVYKGHHLFITATSQEGMSNAMLEAMACGLPIITTYCEGIDELIKDNGLVVDQVLPKRFAELIRYLASDPDRLSAMSIAARRHVEGFSWTAVAERYLEFYNTIAKCNV